MTKVFLIPGLGADSRAYDFINLPGYETVRADWIEPDKTDTLKTYSQKLIRQYNITSDCIVIGNSLGGMVAMEVAQLIPVKKTILISSIKTIDEAPAYFAFFRALPVYKIIPGKLLTSIGGLARVVFGKMDKNLLWLFKDMLQKSSPRFIKWAMYALLHWQNKTIPPNVYTITGDKDLMFNYKRIKDAIIIKGGTHIMIVDRAAEISRIIIDILSE